MSLKQSKALISKPTIITALATITCNGLPAQASEIPNTITMVGFLAAADCFVTNGHGTQEEADKITRDTLTDHPHLRPAYKWLTTTPNGNAALQATIPYLTPDCSSLTASEGEIREVIMPLIK